MRVRNLFALLVSLFALTYTQKANATPQFARETNLPCMSCHSHVPRLNEFGQKFYARGFKLPDNRKTFNTIPAWIAFSAQANTSADTGNTVPINFEDSLIASGGFIKGPQILYHVMWFPVAHEIEGFAIHPITKGLAIQAGKFSPLSQYDPGLGISLSAPQFLSPLDNNPDGTLGFFAPGGSIMGLRATLGSESALPYANGWNFAATVPFSNDVGNDPAPLYDLNRTPRGVFLEGYKRMGMSSLGLNMFAGRDGRHYYGLVAQQRLGKFFLEGGGAYAQRPGASTQAYSLSLDWTGSVHEAYALRIDTQGGTTSYVPTASWMLGGKATAARLVLETSLAAHTKPQTAVSFVFRL